MLLIMLFVYWVDFVWGHPLADEYNETAILFGIPYYFAKRRLDSMNALQPLVKHRAEQMVATNDKRIRADIEREYKINVFSTGRQYWTYEKMIFCPICFHWWICLPILLTNVSAELFLYYLITHFIIRKIV